MNSTPLYESKKITELATLTSASLSGQDIIPIVDNSQKETKSITVDELERYFEAKVFAETSSYAFRASIADMSCNAFSASYATTSSYSNNTVMVLDIGECSTVRCGNSNCASGKSSTIGGGKSNIASCQEATIAGGAFNSAIGNGTSVGGGGSNITNGEYSTVGGGFANYGAGIYSVIGGGNSNQTTCWFSSIVGGNFNCATGLYSSIIGGASNISSGSYSVVAGGQSNLADGCFSGILGGCNNQMCGCYNSFIIGSDLQANKQNTTFVNNLCVGQNLGVNGDATIAGELRAHSITGIVTGLSGSILMITGSGDSSTMRVGANNDASGDHSTVSGGQYNRATGSHSNVAGGGWNTVYSVAGVIAGGEVNSIHGDCSGILGGHDNNTSTYTDAFIIGSNLNATANCTTFVNNLCVAGNLFATSSWATSSSYANQALTASYVIPTTSNAMVGSIIIYPSSTIPTGWLLCDGSQYNPTTYPGLNAVIGTTFGPGAYADTAMQPESTSQYGDSNNGVFWITPHGGSGYFAITLNGQTHYVSSGTGTNFSSLNSGNYSYTITDYGVSPAVIYYPPVFNIGYGGGVSNATISLTAATYRVPALMGYFTVTKTLPGPIIYIIKT